jgi:hypothetical protein
MTSHTTRTALSLTAKPIKLLSRDEMVARAQRRPWPPIAVSAQPDRLVDEMALALLGAGETGSDIACWQALRLAGFDSRSIGLHLDAARDLARNAMATP